ncbi:MAG: hypothetical protein KDB63_03010 [Nocardioidaceae bacterium]|nr:hypothetical protein [Nocardioidaceae bacterium]
MNKLATLTAAALLTTLAACGGGGSGAGAGAPTDASVDDFCTSFVAVFTEGGADMTGITGKDIKAWGDTLAETGTPAEMSKDERAGFEIFVKFASEVDAGASIDDIEDPKVSDDEQAQVDAFLEYSGTTCAQAMQDAMLESMG